MQPSIDVQRATLTPKLQNFFEGPIRRRLALHARAVVVRVTSVANVHAQCAQGIAHAQMCIFPCNHAENFELQFASQALRAA